jgi:hypothetical protein
VAKLPSTWVNLRAYPRPTGTDIGDLRVGDVVQLYAPEVQDWVFVENAAIRGWVARQNGTVVFAQASAAQAAEAESMAIVLAQPQSSDLLVIDGRASIVAANGKAHGRRNPVELAVWRIRQELDRFKNKVRA